MRQGTRVDVRASVLVVGYQVQLVPHASEDEGLPENEYPKYLVRQGGFVNLSPHHVHRLSLAHACVLDESSPSFSSVGCNTSVPGTSVTRPSAPLPQAERANQSQQTWQVMLSKEAYEVTPELSLVRGAAVTAAACCRTHCACRRSEVPSGNCSARTHYKDQNSRAAADKKKKRNYPK